MKSSSPPRKIIGITGAFGSGKTTAAEFFKSKGYVIVTLSSSLEKEAIQRGLPLTRQNLQDLGNEMRKLYGAGILMKKALYQNNEQKIVVDGLRNLGEVEELRQHAGSTLLAIVADRNIRFERLKKLKRRETLTQDLFNSLDLRDLGVNEKITGLQTALCIALADVYIDSNGTLEEFESDLEKFIKSYGK
jgi:dephospho-CoA kinase